MIKFNFLKNNSGNYILFGDFCCTELAEHFQQSGLKSWALQRDEAMILTSFQILNWDYCPWCGKKIEKSPKPEVRYYDGNTAEILK